MKGAERSLPVDVDAMPAELDDTSEWGVDQQDQHE